MARTTDPITSHRAAEGAKTFAKSQCEQVLAALTKHPYTTTRELSELAHIDRYTVARRMPTLERNGLVVRAGIRDCSISGKSATAWRVK